MNVEDHKSIARGWGSAVSGDGAGKAKVKAMPASEPSPMNGIVRRSAPRDTSRRTSCGVVGALKSNRGSSPRLSGTIDSDAASYNANPEIYGRISSSNSSRYSDCCVFSNGNTGAKYATLEHWSSGTPSPYNSSVASMVNACVRSTIFTLRFTPGACPITRSASPTTISGLSFRTAPIYSSPVIWRKPTEVRIATAFGVFVGGQIIGGTRRGPMIKSVSSGIQMNLRRADSCGSVGVLYIVGMAFLGSVSTTDLSPWAWVVSISFCAEP